MSCSLFSSGGAGLGYFGVLEHERIGRVLVCEILVHHVCSIHFFFFFFFFFLLEFISLDLDLPE